MNSVKPVQQNMMYKVNPVNLYTSRNYQELNKGNLLDRGLFKNSNLAYGLNHPKVAGSDSKAKFLDLMT